MRQPLNLTLLFGLLSQGFAYYVSAYLLQEFLERYSAPLSKIKMKKKVLKKSNKKLNFRKREFALI